MKFNAGLLSMRNVMENNNLLLVDDDPFILEGIGSDLEINGYRVTRAASGEIAPWQEASIGTELTGIRLDEVLVKILVV